MITRLSLRVAIVSSGFNSTFLTIFTFGDDGFSNSQMFVLIHYLWKSLPRLLQLLGFQCVLLSMFLYKNLVSFFGEGSDISFLKHSSFMFDSDFSFLFSEHCGLLSIGLDSLFYLPRFHLVWLLLNDATYYCNSQLHPVML